MKNMPTKKIMDKEQKKWKEGSKTCSDRNECILTELVAKRWVAFLFNVFLSAVILDWESLTSAHLGRNEILFSKLVFLLNTYH